MNIVHELRILTYLGPIIQYISVLNEYFVIISDANVFIWNN